MVYIWLITPHSSWWLVLMMRKTIPYGWFPARHGGTPCGRWMVHFMENPYINGWLSGSLQFSEMDDDWGYPHDLGVPPWPRKLPFFHMKNDDNPMDGMGLELGCAIQNEIPSPMLMTSGPSPRRVVNRRELNPFYWRLWGIIYQLYPFIDKNPEHLGESSW